MIIIDNYCIYLRKSRKDKEAELHGEGETLLRQEKILTNLADKLNFNITFIYKEIVSGETIYARPQMQKMLKDIENNLYKGVLVAEIERLARGNTKEQGIIAEIFKYSNTKIITPQKIYDPENEFDEQFFEFGLYMSRIEYKTINRRIQRGRIDSVNEGKFIGSKPAFGYKKVKLQNGKGYKLEIDNEKADIVKLIFNLYVNGEIINNNIKYLGFEAIAKKLNSLGLTPKDNKYWNSLYIKNILTNPVYIGKIRWQNSILVKNLENGSLIIKRIKNDNCIIKNGLHNSIIDADTFNKANEIINNKKRLPITYNKTLKNPFAKLIYCSKCGTLMIRKASSKKNGFDSLICPNKCCKTVSCSIVLLESLIINEIKEILKKNEFEWKLNNKINSDSLKLKGTLIKNLKNELIELNKQSDNIFDLLEKGIYSSDIFIKRNKIITNKINQIHKNLKNLEAEYKREKLNNDYINSFIPESKNIIDVYYNIDSIQEKNELLKTIIDKIIYTKDSKGKRNHMENAGIHLKIYLKYFVV